MNLIVKCYHLFIYSFMPFYNILLYFHERKKGTGGIKNLVIPVPPISAGPLMPQLNDFDNSKL